MKKCGACGALDRFLSLRLPDGSHLPRQREARGAVVGCGALDAPFI
ncbi:MAG: hypothetical protein IJN37_02595 [Clostridia bacterium]|nr:hypothetical protein [Clostridia bacterium]